MNVVNSLLLSIFAILNTYEALQRLSWKDPKTWYTDEQNLTVDTRSLNGSNNPIQYQTYWTQKYAGDWWWKKSAEEQETYTGDPILAEKVEAIARLYGPRAYDTYSNSDYWYNSFSRGNCKGCNYKRRKAQRTIRRYWKWFSYNYVKAFYRGNERIRCTVVENNWKDGTGGYINFVTGGPDFHHFYVELKSRYFRGFSFSIYIYTECPNLRHLDQHLHHHHHNIDLENISAEEHEKEKRKKEEPDKEMREMAIPEEID